MKFIVATIYCFLIVACAEGNPQRKIIDGFPASQRQFQYQVSLQSQTGHHFCGGSILNSKTILTACHCFYNKSQEIMESDRINTIIVVGSINKNEGSTYEVKSVKCHEEYDYKHLLNDIALLEVETEIQFIGNVQPITLPTSNIADNKKLNVSGWGMTYYEGTLKDPQNVKNPDKLQFLEYRKINSEKCFNIMKSFHYYFDTEGMLCAWPVTTDIPRFQGFCSGDSGGPLVGEDGKQYGIVSAAGEHCAGEIPDVFTNVYNYIDWIKNRMFVSPNYEYNYYGFK